MTLDIPRRQSAAPKLGPRLEISPLDLKEWLQHPSGHGLSRLLQESEAWAPFVWKGQDLSAPVRALWVAEKNGLLTKRGERAVDVPIAQITADVNEWLQAFGKAPVSDNAILNSLRTVSQYVAAAVGITLIPDRMALTVRLVDQYESASNIEGYFRQVEAKLKKLGRQLEHAQACGYDVSNILAASEERTGLRVLPSAAAA
jgi:hypothetical protein